MTKCPGICIESRIADYCDAAVKIDSLCKPGHMCCVSRDAFGSNPPAEFYVIDRTKLNSTRHEEKVDVKATSTIGPTSTSNTPATVATTTARPRPVVRNPCKGECMNGLFALFCDDVDKDADCPNDGSCCITLPEKTVTSNSSIFSHYSLMSNFFFNFLNLIYICFLGESTDSSTIDEAPTA